MGDQHLGEVALARKQPVGQVAKLTQPLLVGVVGPQVTSSPTVASASGTVSLVSSGSSKIGTDSGGICRTGSATRASKSKAGPIRSVIGVECHRCCSFGNGRGPPPAVSRS